MKIHKLTVENIKSFNTPVTIEFDERLNILVGPNGGGKSNLLDIIHICLRHFIVLYYTYDHAEKNLSGVSLNNGGREWLRPYAGNTGDQRFTIELKVSPADVAAMSYLFENRRKLSQEFKNQEELVNALDSWGSIPSAGQCFTYSIANWRLSPVSDGPGRTYQSYLRWCHALMHSSAAVNNVPAPLGYFGPARSAQNGRLMTNLSNSTHLNSLSSYAVTWSTGSTSLMQAAAIRFSEKKFLLQDAFGRDAGAKNFQDDSDVKLLDHCLKKLGYTWSLEDRDRRTNSYELRIHREGKTFAVDEASSGEKEIINFAFGLFAQNILGGCILIDEPELHLHPAYQRILLDIFFDLGKKTDNQFLIVTHSPVLISPESISYVKRISKGKTGSECNQVSVENLPKAKDLVRIVNTLNNEKMFFAEKVVLVEGIKDRLVFAELIRTTLKDNAGLIEVVEVGGKKEFGKYRDLLSQLKIKTYIIADQDYSTEFQEVRGLFETDDRKLAEHVKDKKSLDGAKLIQELRAAIEVTDVKELNSFMEYLSSRRVKLKELTEEEEIQFEKFINDQRKMSTYILSKGEIEVYFPEDCKSLEALISKIATQELWNAIEKGPFGVTEFKKIVEEILVS